MQELLIVNSEMGRSDKPVRPEVANRAQLIDVARKFEAAFLSEMLRHSGLGDVRESFGGGVGEAGFSGFLVQAYAEQISDSGRLGIAEHVFSDLLSKVQE